MTYPLRIKCLLLLSCCAMRASLPTASAETLGFTFIDEVGDPRDNFDLARIDFEFDTLSGDFWVTATATEEYLFDGPHLLYLSIFNPDAESSFSFFSISRFSFSVDDVASIQTRSGNQEILKHWDIGDRVASYDLFGSPTGTPFSSVLGGNTRVFSNSDEIRDDAVIVPAKIPEPRLLVPMLMLVAGLLAFRANTRQL